MARVKTNVTFPPNEIFGPALDVSIRSIPTQLIIAQTSSDPETIHWSSGTEDNGPLHAIS